MKVCTVCNQAYPNEEQNYCLNDGSILVKQRGEAPPTVFMNPARVNENTNRMHTEPPAPWQSNPVQQNQPFSFAAPQGKNQTLPTVALVLGILSLVLVCCYVGIPFGIGAVVTGYLGLNNVNKDSVHYSGRGLAIVGMILGSISFVISLVMIIFVIIGNVGR